MNIDASISCMFEKLSKYPGNFGDPIVEAVDFDPIEVLTTNNRNLEVGAGIALLVNFCNDIDNSTYKSAIKGVSFKQIQEAIDRDFCSRHKPIIRAFHASSQSEDMFYKALSRVYSSYVAKST